MSELSRNQLLSRRLFLRRGVEAGKVAAAGATLMAFQGKSAAADSKTPNPWAYDDSAFRRTDPKLIHYHETARFPIPYPDAHYLAITADDRLIIAAGKRITTHNSNGAQLSEFAVDQEARCVAAAPDGVLYVGLRDHIEVFDSAGQRRSVWEPLGKKTYLTGICAGENDVFVADAGNRVVVRLDRSGKITNRIGERNKDQKAPGFIVPSPFFDVKIAADGLLRVTNPGRHLVEAYTFDGDLEFAWGRPGAAIENFCGCCNPINLVPLPDRRMVTLEKGIPRVKVYTIDGRLESVIAGAESFVENAKVCGPNDCTLGGLAGVVDSKGRVHILDLVAANLRIMERNKEGA